MDRRSLSRATRILWPFASLWLLLATAVLVFSWFEMRADRAAAITSAREETETFARAARTQLAESLDQYDHALTLQKIVHERKLAAQPLSAVGHGDRSAGVVQRRVDRYDGEGRRVATTDTRSEPSAWIVDGALIEGARGRSSGELLIGKPVWGKIPGVLVVPLAKRLETSDGAFDGVLVTFLDPAQLLRRLNALSTNDRMTVGIADRQGLLYGWTGGGAAGQVEGSLATGAAMPPANGAARELILGGRPSLVARAELPGRDLSVIAALDEEAALVPHQRHVRTTLVFACLTLAAISLTLVLVGRRALAERNRRRRLERRYEEVRTRARTDPLTSVSNRMAFDDQLRVSHALLAANGRPFVLAFIDIDRFKELNDRYGHATGDRALKYVAHLLGEGVRGDDMVARLGGDEFAVLMPGSNAMVMRRVFEPMRQRLNAMAAEEKWPITFSIGVVAFESATPRRRDAVNLADYVMYDVKTHGRDGVRYAVYREGALQHDEFAQAVA